MTYSRSFPFWLSVVLAAISTAPEAAGQPTIHAPEKVPAGTMFMVRITGLDADAKFNWHAVGGGKPILADLLTRENLTPILLVTPDRSGMLHLVLAYLDEDGNPRQVSASTLVGEAPPVPDNPQPDDPDTPPPTTKAAAATYVYEKDDHAIPNPVLAALNRLNRERNILATVLEADTKDGTGDVPAQYKTALDAAKRAGLPCLVVTDADGGVILTVQSPTTEEAVMEAVP